MQSRHVDPSATVDPAAQLQEGTIIEAGCQIGPQVKTSVNVRICARTCIRGEVTIGAGVVIGPDVTLVGPLEIQENARIGRSATIGLETASTSRLPRGTIGKFARIGKGAVVLGRLSVGEYAQVSDGARLEGDLPHHGVAWGSPAALKDFACECGRIYGSFRRISPELYLGKCPTCQNEGYRISMPDVMRCGYTLLPNQQTGQKVPEWFFEDEEEK